MHRLQTRAQFQAVLAGGTLAKTSHFALHRLALGQGGAPAGFQQAGFWIGAMVPKRWAKRAVTRNMIKRQIYSLMVHPAADPNVSAQSAAWLVRLRSGFDVRVFKSASSPALKTAVRAELLELAGRAGLQQGRHGAARVLA